jgi:hypothetical protein
MGPLDHLDQGTTYVQDSPPRARKYTPQIALRFYKRTLDVEDIEAVPERLLATIRCSRTD